MPASNLILTFPVTVSTSFDTPRTASEILMYKSKWRLFPSLFKVGCSSSLISTIKSPGIPLPAESFPFPENTRVTYKLTSEQFKELQDYLSIYGNNKVGRSQVIKIMNTKFLWRTPIIISTNNSQYVKENNSKSSFSDKWGTELK